jgi:hypothetical protein
MAKLVWIATGDEIELHPVDPEIYGYFVQNLNQTRQNRYRSQPMELAQSITELTNYLTTVAELFQTKFDIDPWPTPKVDLLDQHCLNLVHKAWVDLHLQYPNIGTLGDKIVTGTRNQLFKINRLIHGIEESFNVLHFETPDPFTNFSNPFGQKILNFDCGGIRIDYNNLGRSTFNKWKNFDDQINGTDVNNFAELYTSITVSLARPYTGTAPKEYLDWASSHNIQPHGSTLNLAQFDKLEENLLKYRQLFYKNSCITDNYFTLKE